MRRREICDNQFACHAVDRRSRAFECFESPNVLTADWPDKGGFHSPNAGIFKIGEFSAITHEVKDSLEDRLRERKREVVEWQPADHKVVFAFESRVLDRLCVQPHGDGGMVLAKVAKQAFLEVPAEDWIQFDDVKGIVSTQRAEDLCCERSRPGTNLKNSLLSSVCAK